MHSQGSSGRPQSSTSPNSVLTFAESLRTFRTPSPTDDEAEQIWEAARNAPPLFPELHLGQSNEQPSGYTQQPSENARHDAQSIYHLGPGERAVVRDTRDAAGNRQSVLLVYETDCQSAQSSPTAESYDDCVVDFSHSPPSESRTDQAAYATQVTPAPVPAAAGKGKGKANATGKIYRLKKVFKLATAWKPTTERSAPQDTGNAAPGLPAVRPVQLPASSNGAPKLAEPVPRKTVGHPDRMTRWMDFSQYTAEEAHAAADAGSRRKRTPDLNKPLPNVPGPNSHLRLTVYSETMPRPPDSPPPMPADAAAKIQAAQRKGKNRRTAVYAGSTFSSSDDTYDSSPFTTPASTHHTPPTSGDEFDRDSVNAERLQLLERLQKLGVTDDDEDEDPRPVIDTFVHDRHTSFVVTERLDDSTVRSLYGTQERRDGDSPSETDPARMLWNRLTRQVGSPGWSGD